MARFRYPEKDDEAPESPEALFRDLRPRDRSVRDLYLRQGDVLRAYQELSPQPSDVALELPTGAGKTLVGLLIAEYRRRAFDQRVAYLCPTVQLARQAASKAESYGIDAVTLVRKQRDWDPSDFQRYQRRRAIAISTYFAVFNSNPRLDSAQTLVLDDAHAGEGPVSSLWSIRADRDSELYRAVVALVSEALPESTAARLRDDDLDLRRQRDVDLVPPLALYDRASALLHVLQAHAEGDSRYALDAVGDNAHRGLLYISWRELLLRPLIAPTADHAPFAQAEQRVYMSATLGSGGELERAFGVPNIARPHMPTRADERGFGRRLFLMPGAAYAPARADRIIRDAISAGGRAVVLAQSYAELQEAIEAVVPEGHAIVSAEAVEHSLSTFTAADNAVLALANRYDGIDLPDGSCRLIVLSGLPRGAHLQERFLSDRLGASRVIAERVRTRLTQGSGRCTRNPQDFAAVILRDSALIDFCGRGEELGSLRPELQAEIDFGLDNSEEAEPDFLGALHSFFDRDEEWLEADGYLRHRTSECDRTLPPGSRQLQSAAPFEVAAWASLWRGDEQRSVAFAQQAVDALGGDELCPYRVLWLYLAASWARQLGEAGDTDALALAEKLQADAESVAAHRVPWVPRHPRRPTKPAVQDVSQRGERAAIVLQHWGIRGALFERRVAAGAKQIRDDRAKHFEAGLLELGRLLGFDAERPEGEAAPDGAWLSDAHLIVWEAKTGKKRGGALSAEEVRQAETHPRWVERQLGWKHPDRVITIIVMHDPRADQPAADVAGDQWLVDAADIRALYDAAVNAHREVRAQVAGLDDRSRAAAFEHAFTNHDLDNHSLIARLTTLAVTDAVT